MSTWTKDKWSMTRHRKDGHTEYTIHPYDNFKRWAVLAFVSGKCQIIYDGISIEDASNAFGEDVREHYSLGT